MRRFLILIFCLAVTAFLGADQVSVQGVELLEGDHVVQLRFVTSEAIPPIPNVTEKDGNRLLLASADLSFQLNQTRYEFDSPLIKSVSCRENDVEIELSGKIQYRLFSNENGLFVEFPKELVVSAVQPEKNPVESQPRKSSSGLNVQVKHSDLQSVQLLVRVPPETPYEIIPIEQEPYRLAIDLQGVRGKGLKEEIGCFNVRKIRGGPNTPEIYRIVFDLAFLSSYRVNTVTDGLLVEFYEQNPAKEVKNMVAKTEPPKIEPVEQVKTQQVVQIAEPAEEAFFKEEAAQAQTNPPASEPYVRNENTSQQVFLKTTIAEGSKVYSGEPYDFVFKNMDLVNVLKIIAKLAGLNLVVDPGVSGRVTSELIQVPWDQALDIFLKINKLGMVVEGNIFRVGKVDELAREAEELRKLQEARDQEGKLEVIIRPLSYAKAGNVSKILEKQLSKRGEIQVDERSNSMIISEVPDRVKILDRLIDSLDVANQQVSIEARIVETNHTDASGFGINWGVNGVMSSRYGNQTSLKFPNSVAVGTGFSDSSYAVNLPIAGNTAANTALGLTFGNVAGTFNLDTLLMAMEKKGRVRILSSPRTTTQNNMEAEIINGRRVPIQTQQPNGTYTVTYINAALELKVKPQITAEGTIITEVDIKNDAADFSREVDGRPVISTQSAKNTIMVKDGGTIVIGGLYRVESSDTVDRVPLLGKIPLLGSLFRNKQKYTEKRELLIFITPRIVK